MSAPGWKAPNQERSCWPGGEALFFDKPETGLQLHSPGQETTASPAKYLNRMSVKAGDKIVLIPVRDIVWVQSHGNLLRLHLQNTSYEHRMTIRDICSRLDPERFIRVHRSAIVNLDHVVEFEFPRSGKAFVHLRDGKALPVSRVARSLLKRGLLLQSYSFAEAENG